MAYESRAAISIVELQVSLTTLKAMLARLSIVSTRAANWWSRLNDFTSDAMLYGGAALFAIGLGWGSDQKAQWHWGYMAVTPYALIALASWILSRTRVTRTTALRVGLLAIVIFGAVVLPLVLEARWRQAQPEVSVIQRSAAYVSNGKDPYRSYMNHGHLVDPVPGLPAYESFFPYLPLMSAFGLPSTITHESKGLTDARIVMTLMTLLTSGAALTLLRATKRQKIRIAQVLIALPTGALFLSTGGDDMPIIALLLLGVAGLQRRSNYLAAVSFGVAAALKLTAWPVAAGALLVARERDGRSAWRKILLVVAGIVLITVVPFALHAPWAFVSNVFAFPLGLSGVASPAASALPGHVLTDLWAPLGHVLTPVAFLAGGYFIAKYLRRRHPLNLSQLLGVLSVIFAVLICVASATRIGYVIYPLNFALWSRICQEEKAPMPELVQIVSEF